MADTTEVPAVVTPDLSELERLAREVTGACIGCGVATCSGCWNPPTAHEIQSPTSQAKPSKPRHGTSRRYRRGCRCQRCRAANARLNRELKSKRRQAGIENPSVIPHGAGGYKNWHCRCPVCKAAGSEENRRQRMRRKADPASLPIPAKGLSTDG